MTARDDKRGGFVPLTRDEIEDARKFLKMYFPNQGDDRKVFNRICDMAVSALTYGSALSHVEQIIDRGEHEHLVQWHEARAEICEASEKEGNKPAAIYHRRRVAELRTWSVTATTASAPSTTPQIPTVGYLRGFVKLPHDSAAHIQNLENALREAHRVLALSAISPKIECREAVESSIRFLLERLEGAKCDSDAVSSCIRCNAVFLAKSVRKLLRRTDGGKQT